MGGMYAVPRGDGLWAPFAQLVLNAAYEATLTAAILETLTGKDKDKPGAKKVYLTALGGGVFGNREEWIANAILRACIKFKDVGIEVIIVSFGQKWRMASKFITDDGYEE